MLTRITIEIEAENIYDLDRAVKVAKQTLTKADALSLAATFTVETDSPE